MHRLPQFYIYQQLLDSSSRHWRFVLSTNDQRRALVQMLKRPVGGRTFKFVFNSDSACTSHTKAGLDLRTSYVGPNRLGGTPVMWELETQLPFDRDMHDSIRFILICSCPTSDFSQHCSNTVEK